MELIDGESDDAICFSHNINNIQCTMYYSLLLVEYTYITYMICVYTLLLSFLLIFSLFFLNFKSLDKQQELLIFVASITNSFCLAMTAVCAIRI